MSVFALRRLLTFGSATFVAAVVLAPLAAAQTRPAPTHDVVFDVNNSTYTGGTTFAIDKDGKVAGIMRLDVPAVVDAKLNGEVKNGVWKFDYPFTMDNQGQACRGTVSGTAKVASDGSQASGSVLIGGDCTPEPMAGTFTFKKRAK